MRPLILLFLSILTFVRANMMPNPLPYFVTDEYGVEQGPIYLKGTMTSAREEDEEGYTVLPDPHRTYFYARQDEITGELVATTLPIRAKVDGVLVGTSPSEYGISPHEKESEEARLRKCGDFCMKEKARDRQLRKLTTKTTGILKNLIVLFRFHDHQYRALPSKLSIETLMNHPGDGVSIPFDATFAPTGSVRFVVC
jgi:hypothetical protein